MRSAFDFVREKWEKFRSRRSSGLKRVDWGVAERVQDPPVSCGGVCQVADVLCRTGCDDPCMTELANPATHNHPSFDRAQAALDAARRGDYGPTFEALADEVILENGPGAGPWRVARGKADMGLLLLEFSAALGNTFHQEGRCVYADDRVVINLIRETGQGPDRDQFDSLACGCRQFCHRR